MLRKFRNNEKAPKTAIYWRDLGEKLSARVASHAGQFGEDVDVGTSIFHGSYTEPDRNLSRQDDVFLKTSRSADPAQSARGFQKVSQAGRHRGLKTAPRSARRRTARFLRSDARPVTLLIPPAQAPAPCRRLPPFE